MATGQYKGKLTAEVSLFRTIDETIRETDAFLADRAYSSWFEIARLSMRGAHIVVSKHQLRKTDFRTGKRLGKHDHIETWSKPNRPEWMTPEEYAAYPEAIKVREVRVRIDTPGFRTKEVFVVTDLLDALQFSKEDLAALFRRRWQAELNLRSLKTVMQMEHLRCKEPHRVRNEIRAHMIAYNLARQLMCEAAMKGKVRPWQISFKNTMQTLNEMLPILSAIEDHGRLCETMLDCCLKHVVGNRPDRYEPRVVKRGPKSYTLMTKPRDQYKPGESLGFRWIKCHSFLTPFCRPERRTCHSGDAR